MSVTGDLPIIKFLVLGLPFSRSSLPVENNGMVDYPIASNHLSLYFFIHNYIAALLPTGPGVIDYGIRGGSRGGPGGQDPFLGEPPKL